MVPPFRYSSGFRDLTWGWELRIRSIRTWGTRLANCALIAGVLTVASMAGGVRPASAAGNGLYSVFPAHIAGNSARPYFNYLVNPSSTVKDAVTVTNYTAQAVAFKLYSTDAVNTQNGGDFAYNSPDAPKHSVGAWVQLSAAGFTLPAHTLANVPFSLNVPAGMTPGDYAGGIVLQTLNPTVEKRGALTFDLYQNVGTRIYVRIAGPLHPSVSITHLSISTHGWAGLVGGPVNADVTYTLTNTGNKILNPTARLSVSPLVGSTVNIPPRLIPSLLPHNSATITYLVKNQEALLKISADLKVTSGAGTITASTTAWVIPWLLILALVLLGLFFWWWRRRRRRRALAAAAVVAAAAGGPESAAAAAEVSTGAVDGGASPGSTGG